MPAATDEKPDVTSDSSEESLHVQYDLDVEFESDLSPADQFEVCGPEDKEMLKEIYARIEREDVWAWCMVRVIAETRWEGHRYEGKSSWLGGCSYADEADFIKNDDYYNDLCDEAVDNLEACILEDLKDIDKTIARNTRLADQLKEKRLAREKLTFPDVSRY